jgi:hypothetical protein
MRSPLLNSKQAAIKVYDQGGHPLTRELVTEFLDYAYRNTNNGNILDSDVLLNEVDIWIVGLDDEDGKTVRWFSGVEITPFGKKFVVTAAGPLATKHYKAEMLSYRQKLNDVGEHYYTEASGKIAEALERMNIRKVPLDEVRLVLPGKKITPTGEFSYKRKIKGHDIEKVMYGYPDVSATLKTSTPIGLTSNLLSVRLSV